MKKPKREVTIYQTLEGNPFSDPEKKLRAVFTKNGKEFVMFDGIFVPITQNAAGEWEGTCEMGIVVIQNPNTGEMEGRMLRDKGKTKEW